MSKKINLTNTHKIMLSFLLMILTGALLLMLPIAARPGESTCFSGALLCSVSASCVTGLVAYDTWSHWSLFGQLVLLTEMQIGGLGFITIGVFAMTLFRKKIGLNYRALVQDSLSTLQLRGSVRLVRRIVFGTLLFEGLGALLLSLRFVPQFGLRRGLYFSIFHSVSAFCNAGFDLMGIREHYSSFCAYSGDPLVILTLSTLILVGGIGFLVWDDLLDNRWHWECYHFQTKLVLTATLGLLLISTFLFYFTEARLFAGMSAPHRLLAAFFSAVTPRTAGFNSVDTAGLSDAGLFLTILLMFIGGSPGSTAGGIKTITLLVILLHLKEYLFHERDCVLFRTRLEEEAVRKAGIVVFLNLSLALLGVFLILSVQPLPLRDVSFEVFSAIGTAGMSTGITRELCLFSKLVVIVMMYLGRMGSLTFAMSFTERRKSGKLRYPASPVTIG
ncbi:Trk family potassium uptake protein [Oribacterium sp. oral taxon 102]|uniref:TrkH family potassium uptake protein n=1 Tax=Oribacterium sp. oral taxon 102 TaxID=671214 RepID=UPI0015C069D3|nr:potassium transporter TrkG [Oribacterium sp. oral taxon 102]NWO21431.1 Trk family potassium uptake protein [Oribacterium sp. oral taxon 102]